MELPSRVLRTLVAAILLGAPGFAADEQPTVPGLPPAAKIQVDFQARIEPLFRDRCYGCHGPNQQTNGLRLDQREPALKGGNSGAVLVPGDSAASKLIERAASKKAGFRMPPAGAPLSVEEIGLLRAWIDQGAVWPKTAAPVASARPQEKQSHWSFRPVVRASLPTVRNRQWVRNPVDAFILSKLESKGVAPSSEGDKITLIRRLSFALTGLPPAPDEVGSFLADNRPDAYERVVDRLLASEHYGERWAQYWLDLARYADSDGYEKDLPRPYAWRWREWVIDALNRDMPFDEFTIEQIAGDLLPGATVEQQVATGFHRNTLKNREAGVKREEARFEEVTNRVGTVGTVWLGLTVECAQCHDHKFDPIAQKDFYQLFAYFNNAEEADIGAPLPGEMGPYLSTLPAYRKSRSELLSQYPVVSWQAAWEERLNRSLDQPGVSLDWDYEITELRARLDHSERMIRKGPERRTLRENDLITDYFIRYSGPENRKNEPVAEKLKELQKKLTELKERTPALTQAYILTKAEEPRQTHVALRGDYRAPGMEVQPDTPAFLPRIGPTDEPPRLQLAKWLVSPQNPLTVRVAVNRMWQELMGRGIVGTSNDFGAQGQSPTHPELLDWLASEFVAQGWSTKAMHRLIVTSATFRQSSQTRPDLAETDPDNRLFARQNRMRLPAENLRDAALAVSGLLSPEVGGPSVRPPQPESVSKLTYGRGSSWVESTGKQRYRRGLYVHYQRTAPYPQLVNFDMPGRTMCVTQRQNSNTPLQALNLLNDPVFFEAAQALAVEVLEGGQEWGKRLELAFRLALSRPPTNLEQHRLESYFATQKAVFAKEPESVSRLAGMAPVSVEPVEAATWVALCRTLINLNEFITRE